MLRLRHQQAPGCGPCAGLAETEEIMVMCSPSRIGVRNLCALCVLLAGVSWSGSTAHADILYLGDTYADVSTVLVFDTEGGAAMPTTLVSSQPGYMRDISVDSVNGRIYWSCDTTIPSGGYIRSADLSGANVQTINLPQDHYAMEVDGVGGNLYYGGFFDDGSGLKRSLVRMGLDGSSPTSVGTTPSSSVYGIDVDPSAGKVYWNFDAGGAGDNAGIHQSDLNGANTVDIVTGQPYVQDVDVDAARGLVYWITIYSIWRAPIDGSSPPEEILSGMRPVTMALSPDGNTVYFGNGNYTSSVYKMDADGSNLTYVTYVYKPVAIDVVPEPATLTMAAIGALALLKRRRPMARA